MRENQCCKREVSLIAGSQEVVGEEGRPVKVQNNSSSPTSLALMYFYMANQVNIVTDIPEGIAESGNHSLRVVYNVFKVRGQFSLICLVLVNC